MNLLAHVAECVRLGIPIKKTITTYNELLVSTHKSPHQEIPGGENKEVSAKIQNYYVNTLDCITADTSSLGSTTGNENGPTSMTANNNIRQKGSSLGESEVLGEAKSYPPSMHMNDLQTKAPTSENALMEETTSFPDLERGSLECPVCHKVFMLHGSVVRHIKYHHLPPKPLACEFCSRTFKYREGLSYHVNSYHIGVRYLCPTENCLTHCYSTTALRAHQRAARHYGKACVIQVLRKKLHD